MSARLQLRDLEILRTLARLRFVTTREILTTFFSTASVGRRRLRALSEVGYVTPHTKGLTDPWGFRAWRLTPEGIETVTHAFPEEPIPDGLADRLAGASLDSIQHRLELNRIYLGLLRPMLDVVGLRARQGHSGAGQLQARSNPNGLSGPRSSASDQTATEKGTADVREETLRATRERAGAFSWMPDGDVVHRFEYRGESHQLVPDAVVVPVGRPEILYLELDRATKTLRRVRDNLERYGAFFRDLFPGLHPGRSPALIYIVPSKNRAAGVLREGKAVLKNGVRFLALPPVEAIAALQRDLFGEAGMAPPSASVETGAFPRDLAQHLYRELYAAVERHPDVPEATVALLHKAHAALTRRR